MIQIKSIKTFRHHSVSKKYLYMKSEMHNSLMILSCESEKFVGGHENRYLRKDL